MWLFYPLSEILCVILQYRGDSCCSVQMELQNIPCCDLGIIILLGSLLLTVCSQSRAASSKLPEESGVGRENGMPCFSPTEQVHSPRDLFPLGDCTPV